MHRISGFGYGLPDRNCRNCIAVHYPVPAGYQKMLSSASLIIRGTSCRKVFWVHVWRATLWRCRCTFARGRVSNPTWRATVPSRCVKATTSSECTPAIHTNLRQPSATLWIRLRLEPTSPSVLVPVSTRYVNHRRCIHSPSSIHCYHHWCNEGFYMIVVVYTVIVNVATKVF